MNDVAALGSMRLVVSFLLFVANESERMKHWKRHHTVSRIKTTCA